MADFSVIFVLGVIGLWSFVRGEPVGAVLCVVLAYALGASHG